MASVLSTGEELRAHALRLFAEQGFEATGIRQIADAVGITTAAVYYHIANKDELLLDIMRSCLDGLIAGAKEIRDAGGSAVEMLAELVAWHVSVHASQQLVCTVTDTELRAVRGRNRTAIVRLRDEYQDIWREVVQRGIDADEFNTVDPKVTVLALLEMCTGVAHWYSKHGPLSIDAICEAHSRIALGGLGATARDGETPSPRGSRSTGHVTKQRRKPESRSQNHGRVVA